MDIRQRRISIYQIIIIAAIVITIAFFGLQYLTKTGIFKQPGTINYDDSLTNEEFGKLNNIFDETVVLEKDLSVSARYEIGRPELKKGEIISQILVPVTDYYSTETNIDADNVEALIGDPVWSDVAFSMIDLNELDFTKKLLSINGEYYLNDFDGGAVYRIISFNSDMYDEEIKPLVETKLSKTYPSKTDTLSFVQTGVTALSRGMNRKLNEVGDATFFADKIGDYLSGFDLTHTSNESSFSELANGDNICSDNRFMDTLKAIGLDIVELTGNHNQDCGNDDANKTIEMYNEEGIKIIGGGKTAQDAAAPLNIDEKGTKITMLAYNLSTGGVSPGDTPGANQYVEENAITEINAAKERGDFVIVDVQYYECSAYASEYEDPTCDRADSAAGDQVGFFRHLIDLGADIVVGTSAHQPQTYELYGKGAIYYGLGNLFFDQIWWPGTTRSLMLEHYFHDGKLLQTRVVPTVYDTNMQTALMDDETTKWFLQRLLSVRPE